MTVYLDIGAKRIQAYLARTPLLRGRRGASALLEHDRLRKQTESAWSPHAEINKKGKKTDGVLSLCFKDPKVDKATVDAVLAKTAACLQQLAPGVEWDVYVRHADSYRKALDDSKAAERAGKTLLPDHATQYRPLPNRPNEVPVVRFCETCGLDSAVIKGQVEPTGTNGEKEIKSLCADCSCRFLQGGHRNETHNWTSDEKWQHWQKEIAPGGLAAERDLLADIKKSKGLKAATLTVAQDFSDLAALGSGDANHLCTVFIDGNRFGDLFTALKDTEVSLGELSAELNKSVRGALVAATARVTSKDDTCLPVVPHLLGGDDLLASVTADRAWDFVVAFLEDYHRQTADLAAELKRRTGTVVPGPITASAGLVFANVKYPFADCLDLAEAALRRAKSKHKARKPAMCWVDVTEDGPELPSSRSAPLLTTLTDQRAVIDKLFDIPLSGRAQLAKAARQSDDTKVAALAHRLGTITSIRPFLLAEPPIPLADALVLGRWWQCEKND